MVMSALPTNWNPNHTPTAAELKQVLDAIKLAQDPPGVIVRRSSNQTIGNSAFTDISFNTEVVDPYGMFAPTSTAINILYDGYYYAQVGIEWSSASRANLRHQKVTLNNVEIDGAAYEVPCPASGRILFNYGNGVSCVAGDVLRTNVWQNTGGNLDVVNVRFTVVRVFGPGV